MNVFPIQAPSQEGAQSKCSNCGAAVVADQRYCLECGQPCSPTRLAFLDVLQAEGESLSPVTLAPPSPGYLPPLPREEGALGWLRRYAGLLSLLTVLLLAGLIGLLVGHWLAPSKAPAAQIVKIEGGALPVAGAAPSGGSTTPAAGSSAATKAPAGKSPVATEAQEVKEVKEAESPKAKPKAPVKTSSSSLQKLSSSKGKQHQKEIEKLTEGDKPIETGG